MIPFQKHTDKMANSVAHDQTAPLQKQSGPGLHCLPRHLDHCGNKISIVYLYAIIIPFQKHTDKMSNSADHDQTAPLEKQSDPGPHCSPRPVCLKKKKKKLGPLR